MQCTVKSNSTDSTAQHTVRKSPRIHLKLLQTTINTHIRRLRSVLTVRGPFAHRLAAAAAAADFWRRSLLPPPFLKVHPSHRDTKKPHMKMRVVSLAASRRKRILLMLSISVHMLEIMMNWLDLGELELGSKFVLAAGGECVEKRHLVDLCGRTDGRTRPNPFSYLNLPPSIFCN